MQIHDSMQDLLHLQASKHSKCNLKQAHNFLHLDFVHLHLLNSFLYMSSSSLEVSVQ